MIEYPMIKTSDMAEASDEVKAYIEPLKKWYGHMVKQLEAGLVEAKLPVVDIEGFGPRDLLCRREKMGWTQQQLADFLSCSKSSINNWERQYRPVPVPTWVPRLLKLTAIIQALQDQQDQQDQQPSLQFDSAH